MAHVGVPQDVGRRGLPAQASVGAARGRSAFAVQSVLAVQAPHGGGRDEVLLHPPIEQNGPQDQRHRGLGVLAPDVQKQGLERGGEVAPATPIPARLRAQAGEPLVLVGVQPALQRRDAEGAGVLGPRRSEALLAQFTQFLLQLSS